MVGGKSRKDDNLVISNTNVFAALDTRKKKKRQGSSKTKEPAGNKTEAAEKKDVFWAPAPLTVKSWADVDDEDDDDYYATAAPPRSSVWSGAPDQQKAKDNEEEAAPESESEEEDLEEDEDVDDEDHEHGPEAPEEKEPVINKASEVSQVHKDPERQLSKKELKKKGLEELDALLAELGIKKETDGQEAFSGSGVAEEKKLDNLSEEVKNNATGPAESKTAKKKKRKDNKSAKELKESQAQHGTVSGNNRPDEAGGDEKADNAPPVDLKERLKKVSSVKKKKSSKEMDAAARAAASEAAARSAKLAAAKKKEKTHYHQQPVR